MNAPPAIPSDRPVGSIAVEYPVTTEVLDRFEIDFYCQGNRTLARSCEERGVDIEAVRGELVAAIGAADDAGERWDEAPLADLVTHIESAYHRPLERELPHIEELARRVAEESGQKYPDVYPELLTIVLDLRMELEQHMRKEEEILFPMVRDGQCDSAYGPIAVMLDEHLAAGAALRRLRQLTRGFQAPTDAGESWRDLCRSLAALESALHRHIHLENNILFPRAKGL